MKKNADQFVEDLLSGQMPEIPAGSPEESWAEVIKRIDADYDFSKEDLEAALTRSKGRLESVVGVPLTEDQLAALAGGKTSAAQIGRDIGIAFGVTAVGGAVGGAVAGAALYVVVSAALAAAVK
jgi:hypothetical protein